MEKSEAAKMLRADWGGRDEAGARVLCVTLHLSVHLISNTPMQIGTLISIVTTKTPNVT